VHYRGNDIGANSLIGVDESSGRKTIPAPISFESETVLVAIPGSAIRDYERPMPELLMVESAIGPIP